MPVAAAPGPWPPRRSRPLQSRRRGARSRVVATPGYDKMVAQAEDLINNSQYEEATVVLKKAIASNPERWQAYNSLAKVQLYFTHDPTRRSRITGRRWPTADKRASTCITITVPASSPRRAQAG